MNNYAPTKAEEGLSKISKYFKLAAEIFEEKHENEDLRKEVVDSLKLINESIAENKAAPIVRSALANELLAERKQIEEMWLTYNGLVEKVIHSLENKEIDKKEKTEVAVFLTREAKMIESALQINQVMEASQKEQAVATKLLNNINDTINNVMVEKAFNVDNKVSDKSFNMVEKLRQHFNTDSQTENKNKPK